MKISPNPSTDQECRSLLQKAVRRGDVSVTEMAVIKLLALGDNNWLRARLGVIAFEECWHITPALDLMAEGSALLKEYRALALTDKNKDAAGLGIFGYELSEGGLSVLGMDGIGLDERREIKVVAEGMKRPVDYWRWVKSLNLLPERRESIRKAEVGYKLAGWPWDKAFAIAAAYLLATKEALPAIHSSPTLSEEFPYWVAIDKHTSKGKAVLSAVADKEGYSKNALGWVWFYMESAKVSNLVCSPWWASEIDWRLSEVGMSREGAQKIWKEVSPEIEGMLAISAEALRSRVADAKILDEAATPYQDKLV